MKKIWQDFSKKINPFISWSSLAAIGASAPARLTILAPLIGYLAIYNKAVSDFLFFGGVCQDGFSCSGDSGGVLELFLNAKLAFLYFGLVLFGAGSAVFAAFAPREVKSFKSIEGYISAMEAVQTDGLVIKAFDSIAEKIDISDYDGEFSKLYWSERLDLPGSVIDQFTDLLKFAGEQIESSIHEQMPQVYNPLGNIVPERVLEPIKMRRRVDRAFWASALFEVVGSKSRDVFFVHFEVLEFVRFNSRFSCAALFLSGGCLLLVPTVITSFQVLSAQF